MADSKKQLPRQIGMGLVEAELGRRGILATPITGGVPNAHLLAQWKGNEVYLQVKTCRLGSVSVDAADFLDIRQKGGKQTVVGLLDELDTELVCVFVYIGDCACTDRFQIIKYEQFAEDLMPRYERFLQKHKGTRPRNPKSTQHAVRSYHLAKYDANWKLIEKQLKKWKSGDAG